LIARSVLLPLVEVFAMHNNTSSLEEIMIQLIDAIALNTESNRDLKKSVDELKNMTAQLADVIENSRD